MTRSGGAGIVPTLGAEDLLATIPAIGEVARIEAVSPLRKPGPSLTFDDILGVAARLREGFADGVAGAVVIQGTDTIEESAFALDCLIGTEAPVVVTGAMRGAETAGADGPANMLSACRVAASLEARGRGVLVCLNDEIHAARFVQKSHTVLPSAFASPSMGPVGLVAEGLPRFLARTELVPTIEGVAADPDRPVALLTIGLGDDGRLLAALPDLGFAGAVIAAMGAGHVPAALAGIAGEVARRIPLVLATRVAAGPGLARSYGYPGAEIDLLSRGLISAGSLSALKARVLLGLLLRAGHSGEALARAFARCV